MKLFNFRKLVTILTGLLIAAYVPYHVNSMFPVVGWDHKYFFTRLIDTYLHYSINGFAIQWYTPSFGGGLPAYPHPLNAQYSLPQFLALLIDPWQAVMVTYFLYTISGYIFAYTFLRRSLQFHWSASTLGAAIFSANGFYLEHLANGHFNFQGFMLLPVFLAVLLNSSLPLPAAGAVIGLASAIIIYSASTYPLIFILLSITMCLPLAYLFRPEAFDWRRILKIALLGGALALSVNLSKLYAVNSFMSFFPRDMPDRYDVPLHLAPLGLFYQLVGVMGFAPIFALSGEKMTAIRALLQTYTGSGLGLWELDLSLSPVIWFLLAGGLGTLAWKMAVKGSDALPGKKGFWLALVILLLAVEISLEFTFARGFFYPIIRQLPFLRALHINPRFGSAFIMPLALTGAAVFHFWVKNKPEKTAHILFLPLNILVVASLGAYWLIPLDRLQQRNFDITGLLRVYEQIKAGETFPIESVGDVTDQTVFERRTSNLHPYEVLFGYSENTFHPAVIEGPVREIQDGAFNMTDPTGLVYPAVNGSSTWSRIPAGESDQLEDFLAHRQPDWEIPYSQRAANWVSLISLIMNIGLLAYGMLRAGGIPGKRGRRDQPGKNAVGLIINRPGGL